MYRLSRIALLPLVILFTTGCQTAGGSGLDNDRWGSAKERQRAEAYNHYLSAILYERQGEFRKALEELEKVPALDPEAITPALRLIRTHIRQREFDKARDLAERVLQQRPEAANLWVLLGQIYHQEERLQDAIEAFEKAIEVDPDNTAGYGALAELQESTNDLIAANDIYEQLIAANPDSASLHYQYGLNAIRIGDTEKAIESLRRVLQLNPNMLRAQYLLGTLYLEADRNEECWEVLAPYVQRRSQDFQAVETLAGALTRMERYPEAMAMLGALINSGGGQPGHHVKAMYVLLRDGKPKDAEMVAPPSGAPYFGTLFTAFARADQGKPHAPLLESLDEIDGDLQTALDTHLIDLIYLFDDDIAGPWLLERIRWARGEAPNSHVLTVLEARVLVGLGKWSEAAAILETLAPGIERETAWIHESLAICYEELDQFEDTERHLKAYLDYWPDDADTLNFLGYLYAEEGVKLDEATVLLEKALDLDPDNPFYLDSLGWVYYRQGKADEAIDYIGRAILGMDSDDAVLRDHLGDAYLLKGDVERALEEWERARRLDPDLEGVTEKLERYGQ